MVRSREPGGAVLGRGAWLVRVALLGCTLLGCSDRPSPARADAATTNDAKPATPTQTPPETTCQRDPDCVGDWSPQHNGCGPVDRCFDGRCLPPPAITGAANAHTAQLVFETPAGERRYAVEIVDDRFEITRGLMCRRAMKPDWGMLFLMESTRVQSFWMQNTLIPLDMIFITEDWRIAGVVARAEPLTRTARSVGRPSRYVLELVAGEAARAGLTAGVRARFYPPRAAE